MKANISNLRETTKSLKFRDRELIHGYKVLDGRSVIIDVRLYMSRSSAASVVYCALWIQASPYGRGAGKAGGYGYDKNSAAVGYAIDDAGITLDKDIDGRGEYAIIEALEAIAQALGAKNPLIVDFQP
jgi:hypothetical protein